MINLFYKFLQKKCFYSSSKLLFLFIKIIEFVTLSTFLQITRSLKVMTVLIHANYTCSSQHMWWLKKLCFYVHYLIAFIY